jgi:hypothetical protein
MRILPKTGYWMKKGYITQKPVGSSRLFLNGVEEISFKQVNRTGFSGDMRWF